MHFYNSLVETNKGNKKVGWEKDIFLFKDSSWEKNNSQKLINFLHFIN